MPGSGVAVTGIITDQRRTRARGAAPAGGDSLGGGGLNDEGFNSEGLNSESQNCTAAEQHDRRTATA
jgi:hypothetical protein